MKKLPIRNTLATSGKVDESRKLFKYSNLNWNTAQAQCKRLLAALKAAGSRGVTTIEARSVLDILSPASRILELRKKGFQISTEWTIEHSHSQKRHRVARYILIRGELIR